MAIGLSGGDELRKKLNGIAEKIGRGKEVRVGFLEGATYPDGTPVAQVAAIQEFGTATIPARPFFRHMIQEKKGSWGASFNTVLKAQDMDAAKALDLMGTGIGGQLVQSINEWTDPPNAPSTIAQKGFDKPLIDKAHMRNSVDHEVKAG